MKNKTEKLTKGGKQEISDQKYEKFASGLIIVKSENSNFNADFTHTPRRLPDENGTIYATDKSLKYCMRKYLKDNSGEIVFGWRRKTNSGDPINIDENYKQIFLVTNLGDKNNILQNLVRCIDIRLFGVTFAPEEKGKNVSLTGTVQISYGINKYNENVHYSNQILSPYQPKEKGQQTTIGEESKALESHYVFDFIVNPNHLKDGVDHLNSEEKGTATLTQNDIKLFKEAARVGVSNVNSTTKIGSENELLLYVEYDRPIMLQNLKDFITIERDGDKKKVKLTELLRYLKTVQSAMPSNDTNPTMTIEVYYEPNKTELEGTEDSEITISKYNLITGDQIQQ